MGPAQVRVRQRLAIVQTRQPFRCAASLINRRALRRSVRAAELVLARARGQLFCCGFFHFRQYVVVSLKRGDDGRRRFAWKALDKS